MPTASFPSRRQAAGFTLVELMIVVGIVAILAAVAIPSYQESVRRGRRADARVAMTNLATRLERCFTQFGAYDAGDCDIASPADSRHLHADQHRAARRVGRDARALLVATDPRGRPRGPTPVRRARHHPGRGSPLPAAALLCDSTGRGVDRDCRNS
jgi:type IV pilus assembly protein PilE